VIEKFWSRVDKNGPVPSHRPELGPCWVWTVKDSRLRRRYGAFSMKLASGRYVVRAHRFSFFLANGKWPTPMACHHCDNPPCVRPDHLFEGDADANMKDAAMKGRMFDKNRVPGPKSKRWVPPPGFQPFVSKPAPPPPRRIGPRRERKPRPMCMAEPYAMFPGHKCGRTATCADEKGEPRCGRHRMCEMNIRPSPSHSLAMIARMNER
jgi:hypothetical protein